MFSRLFSRSMALKRRALGTSAVRRLGRPPGATAPHSHPSVPLRLWTPPSCASYRPPSASLGSLKSS
eukprot:scaffold7973_cov315-Pinguiococcus_pyrenoidosus.AAC.4